MGHVIQSCLLSSVWMESERHPDNAIFALLTIEILIPKPNDTKKNCHPLSQK